VESLSCLEPNVAD
jgi:hypothetical protein